MSPCWPDACSPMSPEDGRAVMCSTHAPSTGSSPFFPNLQTIKNVSQDTSSTGRAQTWSHDQVESSAQVESWTSARLGCSNVSCLLEQLAWPEVLRTSTGASSFILS